MSVLVLSSKTGGGHEMRAQALVDLSNDLGIDFEIYRPLESGSPIYSLGTGIYNLIQKTYPGLHKLYFRFLERACLHRSSTFLLGKKKKKHQKILPIFKVMIQIIQFKTLIFNKSLRRSVINERSYFKKFQNKLV